MSRAPGGVLRPLRVAVLTDPEKPKVRVSDIKRLVRRSGIKVSSSNPDLAVVVGGDGIFSQFGRRTSIPLLLVGVRSKKPTDSKAYLAEVHYDQLGEALEKLSKGKYRVQRFRRLEVLINRRRVGEVFTDVYIERGADDNALRYKLVVTGRDTRITESAIGDGVVVTTSAGASGYYSYPDKLLPNDRLDPLGSSEIGEDEVGVCHIVPTFTWRQGSQERPLRYTVPWGCRITIRLERDADARVYAVTNLRRGIRVSPSDTTTIQPTRHTTKIIRLT